MVFEGLITTLVRESNLMTVAASFTPPNMGERKNRWPANVRVTIKWTHPETEPNHPDGSGMRFTPCVSSPMGLIRSIRIGARRPALTVARSEFR
jgi:hypothetical protein